MHSPTLRPGLAGLVSKSRVFQAWRAVSGRGHEPPSSPFRADIEGLRAVAILLVVGYHVGLPGFSGGFMGVDVFYVISGYLITGLLLKEIEQNRRLDVAQFYARRARRLLPAAAVVLLATAVAGSLVYSPLEQELFSRTALATAAYVSNMWFMLQSASYFSATTETNPLLHTWSLGVEEQFYLAWPLLVLLSIGGRGSRHVLVTIMASLALVSFAGCVWLTHLNPPWAFFSLPTRAWEFAVGGLASLIPLSLFQGRGNAARALAWLGLVAIVVAGLTFSSHMPFPGTAAAVAVAGTALILTFGVEAPALRGRLLGCAPLQLLGKLSYSWYLWHWPVLAMAKVMVPTLSLSGRLLCATASLGLAAATYVWIENPLRFNPHLVRRPMMSLGVALAVTVAAMGVAIAWHRLALQSAASPQQQAFFSAATRIPRLYDDNCIAELLDEQPRECHFGDSTSGSTLVLFGDSHAAQWFPALERVAYERGWHLVSMIKASCPAASARVFSRILEREYVECWRWREAALKRIAELRPGVVIASSSAVYVRGAGRSGTESRLSSREWAEGTRQTLAALDAARVRTLLLRDVPRPGFDVPLCLARAAWRSPYADAACGLTRAAVLDDAVFEAEREAAEGLGHITLMDLSDQFCDAGQCEPVRNGVVVYRDSNHLTVAFSESLSEVLGDRVAPLIASSSRQAAR
jgi:peptidoglycan/LPS O-acetylase OafA/YrhL